ncbi:MAG: hypothetical protein V3U09_01370 [Thermoplasmata archaeon]
MKPSDIMRKLNSIQKHALLVLEANDEASVRGKLWFQKEVFLLSRAVSDLAEELDYEPALMGPLSETLDWNLDQLEAIGLLQRRDSTFSITKTGRKCVRLISNDVSASTLELIAELKELLNDLSKDELLALVYSMHPEMTIESEELEGLRPKRKELAIGLFAKGKVGLDRGARIAELPVQKFASLLRRRGVRRYA